MASSNPDNSVHQQWMAKCLALAQRGSGYVSPNPVVGSVLVSENGELLGEGWHKVFGGPHAERNAILAAEQLHGAEVLKKATLYVNLEPCSHFGKTPPCVNLILEKEIPRVVIGMIDPYEKVRGRGIQLLQEKGIAVCVGVLQSQCERLNEAFSHHLATGRPLLTLKMAQTLDGRIATAGGDARWVSGETSRTLVHEWRSQLDAVLVGHNTALVDDPSLTVRHVPGRHPYRIVLDRAGTLPDTLKLFTDDFVHKTIAVISKALQSSTSLPAYKKQLVNAGGALLYVDEKNGRLDLVEVLSALGKSTSARNGFQSILVEAGPSLATALFEQDLVDHFNLFVSPKIIGKGKPVLDGLAIDKMSDALTFKDAHWRQVGEDMLFQGYRRGRKAS